MDYKDLINDIKDIAVWLQGDDFQTCAAVCEEAATAIETLLAEREAAAEELRGICWCCAYGKKWDKAPEWSKMTTCEHMGEQFGRLARVGKSKCPHWQWRGPTPPDRQKEDKHD